MASSQRKHEVITFKADASLLEALAQLPNRSEFIRAAILTALQNVCPLCGGAGVLTPSQRKYWDDFAQTHRLVDDGDASSVHIVCTLCEPGAESERSNETP